MLRLSHIRKTFHPGTANEHLALDDLSLTVQPGEFLVIVGGNGSGKSSLLNAVSGVFPLDSGRISIDGDDVTALPEHARARYIGRVFQDPMMGTAANMTIGENLALAARRGKRRGLRSGLPPREAEEFRQALSTLELGLEDRMETKAGLLSGGQRQALTLLMATLRKPSLLMLDEHTAALDPKTAARVLSLSDRLVRQYGLTTLMVTHNMMDALRYGDRLVMMEEGRVVFEASGQAKQSLTAADLLERFAVVSELAG